MSILIEFYIEKLKYHHCSNCGLLRKICGLNTRRKNMILDLETHSKGEDLVKHKHMANKWLFLGLSRTISET